MTADAERAVAFMHAVAERRARRSEPFPFGIAHFDDELPAVRYLNTLVVDVGARPAASELDAELERLQHGLEHRRVVIDEQELGDAVTDGLRELGFSLERILVMVHARDARGTDTSFVIEAGPAELESLWREELRRERYDDEVSRQLLEARGRTKAAATVRTFAVLVEGRPVSSCELFSNGRVAQIENVETLVEHRGQGLASAVVTRAVDDARAGGHEVVFLLAAESDWPKELYRRLGFETGGVRFEFQRLASVDRLRGLRLRTPRLELRLANEAELVRLASVARGGIHPPEEMPFAVAWTDDAGRPSWLDDFLEHYRRLDRDRRPDRWTLNLTVFLDGEPIGAQSVRADEFADSRTVQTGSWLGAPFQGRGLGTEMRTAVLALAFDGLGAVEARSGAIEGNDASARVSEKLGYVEIGSGTVSPRGTPVRERRFRLTRDTWRSRRRAPVEIEGLEPSLPLLGVTSARFR